MSIELSKIAETEHIMLPEIAAARMKLFESLKLSMLKDSDIQTIDYKGKKTSFIKRSGLRRLALAFNISDEIVKEEYFKEVADDGKPYWGWRVHARATDKNGRSAMGVGSCSTRERQFAHPDHDILATAHTRAKNRAISDLIGSGEVSAEEIEHEVTKEKSIDEVFAGRLDGKTR